MTRRWRIVTEPQRGESMDNKVARAKQNRND